MKIIVLFILLIINCRCTGQLNNKAAGYLQLQYNQTLYDRTIGNNPWGMGTGAVFFSKMKYSFSLAAEFTADYIFVDDKVLRIYDDLTPVPTVTGTINLFAGLAFHPMKNLALTCTGGPSLIAGNIFAGIKPSMIIYLSKDQKWMSRLAFINVFNRDKRSGLDFGVFSVGVGKRLF